MSILSQRSMAGGEIAPALYARTDMVKHQTGLRTCRNAVVMRHGGAQNRAGTKFVAEVKDSSKVVRLIPFVFNSTQTYVLEFGNLYMRVHKAGMQLTLASQNVTGITAANPAVLTYAGADTYANGDEVVVSGVAGALGPYVNGRNFKVAGLNAGANTFQLNYLDGTAVDSSAWPAYTSGGTVEEVYEISTPYAAADLAELQFVQSADVITLVHPSYAPRELARTGDTSWTLSAVSLAPSIDRPTALTANGTAGAYFFKIRVTALNSDYEESLPAFCAAQNITGITKANPAVVTYAGADTFNNGDEVYIEGVTGMTEVNGRLFTINNVNTGANTFELQGVDSTNYTAYSANGTIKNTIFTLGGVTPASPTVAINVSWTASSGATSYNVYMTSGSTTTTNMNDFGFVGNTTVPAYTHLGTQPDVTLQPPVYRDLFSSADNYPSAVTYYQQRLLFANTNSATETVWASRTGQFKNFTSHPTIQDDDAVTWQMAGRKVNEVRHLLDLGRLLVLTSDAEWSVEGNASGILVPGEINPKSFSANGSAAAPAPVVINNTAIYLQARGTIVRDLAFDFAVDGYQGNDLTIFAGHLFRGYSLADWAYSQNPDSVLWAVRSDGALLGLTYVREHQVWGWHRHDTDGTYENVCVVPEGDEDVLYVVVNRTVDGRTVRYVERMASRKFDAIEDAVILDAAATYDGTQVGSVSMTLSGGTTWARGETLTLTASAGTFVDGTGATQTTFVAGDVGNAIHITGADGVVYRCTITAYTSATVVSAQVNRDVPAALRGAARTTWGKAVDQLTGLWHLEGEGVSVFADGFVVANPNNPTYTALSVSDGTLTLSAPYVVIHVGLPYTTDIETLDIDTVQGQPLVDKRKLVTKVVLNVEDTRGVWAGGWAPDDDTVDHDGELFELKARDAEGYDEPTDLATGPVEILLNGEWNSNGRVFIRQSDPVPMTILSISPAGYIPLGG